jgi:hypothetical protein
MNRAISLLGVAMGWSIIGCGGSTALGELPGLDAGGSSARSDSQADSGMTSGAAVSGGREASGGSGGTTVGGTAPMGGSGSTATTATGGDGPASPSKLPCEVLEAAGHACVAAHSTVRVLVGGYAGSLYRVRRSDGETLDIGVVKGLADAAAQTAFCNERLCEIEIIYDQSPLKNDLTVAPPGSAKPTPSRPVNAAALPVKISGHDAFGMLFRPGQGYRRLMGNGTAVEDEPQTIYMVTSQHDLINGCCFDYGNAETSANDDGNGAAVGHG